MRFGLFPNNRALLNLAITLSLTLSIQLYYWLLPHIESFEAAYRWNDYDKFVRFCGGVFWAILALVLSLDTVNALQKTERSDEHTSYRIIVLPPVALLLYGGFELNQTIDQHTNALSLLYESPQASLLIVASLVLSGMLNTYAHYTLKKFKRQEAQSKTPPPIPPQ